MKKCPYCDEEIQEKAQKCRFCGSWLNDLPQAPQNVQQENKQKIVAEAKTTTNCPVCGEEILCTAKKCKHCGEWLNQEKNLSVTSEQATKLCPFCGEEILVTAIKCKHCGENLSSEYRETVNYPKDKISNLNVSEDWKNTFRNIDKIVIDGNMFKSNPEFLKLPIKDRMKVGPSTLPPFGSSIAAYFLGAIYYFVKGMWLKAIVYTIVIICLSALINSFIEIPTGFYGAFPLIWVSFLNYDYYRYKVLGKQW